MIYLTYGTDKNKCRDKHNALIRALKVKNPAASLFKISSENFSSAAFEEMIQGQTLFAQKYIVGCDNLLKEKESLEYLKESIKRIADSDNIFIFLETEEPIIGWPGAGDKAVREKRHKEIELVKKHAVKAQEFINKISSRPEFNIYSIIDAFSVRQKNRAWALYQEALMSGISSEDILWKLIWQVDNMLLIKGTKDQATIKLKPFVASKAKAGAKNFSNEELKKLSAALVDLYHTNYLGTDEFEFGLEKIILNV